MNCGRGGRAPGGSRLFALFLGLLATTGAWAEPQPRVAALMQYMDGVHPCLAVSRTRAAAAVCIGQGSAACMEAEPGGYSTQGLMFCVLAETEAWDRLLNAEYMRARVAAQALDAAESARFPEFATRAESLLAAQRAWIAFRDADCALARAEGGAGTVRMTFASSCRLQMTAERTIDLKFLFAEGP